MLEVDPKLVLTNICTVRTFGFFEQQAAWTPRYLCLRLALQVGALLQRLKASPPVSSRQPPGVVKGPAPLYQGTVDRKGRFYPTVRLVEGSYLASVEACAKVSPMKRFYPQVLELFSSDLIFRRRFSPVGRSWDWLGCCD
jgi:hypothetical protein